MKSKLFVSLSIAILVIVSVTFLFIYLSDRRVDKTYLKIYGNVDIRQVDLGFRVFGRVEKLFFDEGDSIKPNDLLALLDKVPYEEDVAAAKAKVLEVENSYIKSKAQFEKRYSVNKEAISQEEYDNAYYNLKQIEAAYEEAKAFLEKSLTNLEDTRLFCPTAGSILTRIREPGSVVNPGEPIFTVSINEPVWIRAYINEPNLGKIYFGMPAEIFTDTKGLKVYKGHIGFISPVAEFTPKTVESLDLRTDLVYRLRIIVDDPNKELKQGMPVTAKLKLID
ncbi:MAG: efflux RND transporter periplasmic adaptor subunit [Parachlamydiales bacterium]|nr:efflux RND transporter periplasmic adaptor subunit [Parachlamydiales bacterium]